MLISRKITLKAAILLMLLIVLPLFSQSGSDGNELVCTVKGIVGDVKVNRSKIRREEAVGRVTYASGLRAAQVNMALREKDVIQTAAESEVRLETPDGSIIVLGENTTLEMSQLKYSANSSNTKIRLVSGSMITNVKRLADSKTSFEIQTPTATAAIRGTIVELNVGKSGQTEIKVFDGSVLVAPKGSKNFVEVSNRQAVEIVPRQRKLVVTEVPKDYTPRPTILKGEPDPKETTKKSSASAKKTAANDGKAKESAPVKLTLKLDEGLTDTINSYSRESITIKGTVTPPGAKVSINGRAVKPDLSGVFEHVIKAPADPGVFTLRIVANDNDISETVLRTVRVAGGHTEVKLVSPVEGQVVTAPSVLVSGTAASGSKVNVDGKSINVERDGTFSAEVALPDKEGSVKLEIEIIDSEDNAMWFPRNIIYRKAAE